MAVTFKDAGSKPFELNCLKFLRIVDFISRFVINIKSMNFEFKFY
jgi:hypothetical protein